MKRFSTRTIVLMVLALAAFAHLWWRTHRDAPDEDVIRVTTAIGAGGPDGSSGQPDAAGGTTR